MSYIVQSVILKKDKFTKDEAFAWVKKHGYKHDKVDETHHYYRFRQIDPNILHHYRFREIALGKDGYLVVAYSGSEKKE